MYGLVNRAIQGLVMEKFGEHAWRSICREAKLGEPAFVAMESYDDAITYSLVAAAAKELGMEPAAVLEAFGEYWTEYTIEEGYGNLLSMMGSTMEEFLDNLDSMHARIGDAMPMLIPPSFERATQEDGSSILSYASDREGLAPMVVGLLKGLARRFGREIDIEMLEPSDDGHQRFHLQMNRPAEVR